MKIKHLHSFIVFSIFIYLSCDVKDTSDSVSTIDDSILDEAPQLEMPEPEPKTGLFIYDSEVKYDDNMTPIYFYTVSNTFDKTVVAFEIVEYSKYRPEEVIKKVKAKIKPNKKYSSSFRLENMEEYSQSAVSFGTLHYQISRVVFEDGSVKERSINRDFY